ncbi:uncharacterized protein LOC128212944 [Mya arenaria]|uniref:uncharacterized protein LOC128212944 n=1 Tax=Mya arenaria TaxID=6604 RepID=UPI0022E4892C|nr:uncharacterized protein LOC128212944 [Mya arenaria]
MLLFISLLITICVAAQARTIEMRLDLMEKQLNEVLTREINLQKANEAQRTALRDIEVVVENQRKMIEELQYTVVRQNNHIEGLQTTVRVQELRINELEGASREPNPEENELGDNIHVKRESVVPRNLNTENSGIFQRRSPPEMAIAFTAVKVAAQTGTGINQNILFENVILNQGNGFHSNHGVFIAPQSGIYLFTASLLHQAQSIAMHAAIIHEGRIVTKIDGSNDWTQSSQTVVIQVNTGEEVWVSTIDYEHENIHGDSFSAFSGFLLWQL